MEKGQMLFGSACDALGHLKEATGGEYPMDDKAYRKFVVDAKNILDRAVAEYLRASAKKKKMSS